MSSKILIKVVSANPQKLIQLSNKILIKNIRSIKI